MVSKTFSFPRSDFIGFDHIWNDIERLSTFTKEKSYPPHNVVKYTDTEYSIELALAGYKKEDLSIEVKEGILIVSCEGRPNEEAQKEYLWNGISAKKFKRTFRLSEHVVVDGADFIDGLLVIDLRVVVPEEKLPRKIPIGNSNTQFLTEERANDKVSKKGLW